MPTDIIKLEDLGVKEKEEEEEEDAQVWKKVKSEFRNL